MAHATVFKDFHEEDIRDVALVRTSADACLCGNLGRTSRRVAMKLLSCERDRLSQLRRAVTQSQVRSERVLLPLGVYRARSLTALVWDWMPEGSLHSLLYETHLYPELPVPVRLQLLLDVVEGLNCLHAVALPHGTLKATNILLDQQYRAKVCDWGGWTPTCNGENPCVRDLAYLSPEVLQGGTSSVKADMYSFGVVMWEVLNRQQPCEGVDKLQIFLMDTQVHMNLLPLETVQGRVLTQLMMRCLSSEPKQRPLAEECAAELRKAVETFESDVFTTAVHNLKACKQRALLACKHSPSWVLPIELNNLEGYGGCTEPKNLTSKAIPMNVQCLNNPGPHIPKSEVVLRSIPACAPAQTHPPNACCRDAAGHPSASNGTLWNRPAGSRWCGGVCGVTQTPTPPPPNTPTVLIQVPLQQHSSAQQAASPGSGWHRLLLEHRESIVHCMTEGRLNNLLDVLRAQRAVTREDYELISAALTLSGRTRCLLDTCACLREDAAALVATTLGLISTQAARTPRCAGMSLKWQAG